MEKIETWSVKLVALFVSILEVVLDDARGMLVYEYEAAEMKVLS